MVEEGEIPSLVSIGVKDSKKLSPRRREVLAVEVRRLARACLHLELSPTRIDEYVLRRKKFVRLNLLEAEAMAELITKIKPNIAYVDASDADAERFGRFIVERVPSGIEVVSEHYADETYPVVSAASIVAKVERDGAIEKLKEEYGDFGSGYPSDSRTVGFLKRWHETHGDFPPIVRRSWKTLKRINGNLTQTRL